MSTIKNFPILLPKNTDLSKWAVIACDQYTTDFEYWKNLENYVKNDVSTLHIIFPEIYLNNGDTEQRIANINSKMDEYLNNNVFTAIDGMVLTERQISENRYRYGLVACVDLEDYDYKNNSSCIRSTEETIEERLPIRMHIRKNASIELPHILLLIDDVNKTIIEPLKDKKESLDVLYDFDLNMNGGHIKGYKVPLNDDLFKKFDNLLNSDLQKEKYGYDAGILLAVGDGNHSMATAKNCWENLKTTLSEEEKINHPARYVLVEIINVYDPSIDFEPIHRVVYANDQQSFLNGLSIALGNDSVGTLKVVTSTKTYDLSAPISGEQTIIKVQRYLEKEKDAGNIKIEYVHEESQVYSDVAKNDGIGIIMPKFPKDKLFNYVVNVGKLPKKAFSIGEEKTKKYYIEAKRIK